MAEIAGVGESTVKRWVDAGVLSAEKTAGGHRRIPWEEAVRFLRARGGEVRRPELLDESLAVGWPSTSFDTTELRDQITKALDVPKHKDRRCPDCRESRPSARSGRIRRRRQTPDADSGE